MPAQQLDDPQDSIQSCVSPAIVRWDSELARGHAALRLAKARRVPDVRYGLGARWEDDTNRRDYLMDFEVSLDVPIAPNLEIECGRQRVDDRESDAVQAAGHLIAAVVELSARVQNRQDDLGRRLSTCVGVDWNTIASPIASSFNVLPLSLAVNAVSSEIDL